MILTLSLRWKYAGGKHSYSFLFGVGTFETQVSVLSICVMKCYWIQKYVVNEIAVVTGFVVK